MSWPLPGQSEALYADARHVRSTDVGMEAAGGLLGDLQDQLAIIKLYPPYPADEPRRAALIRKILGIQQQLDRLRGVTAEIDLPRIAADSGPGEVDQAMAAAGAARGTIAERRVALARSAFAAITQSTGATDDPESAASLGAHVGDGLAGAAYGITRQPPTSLLGQLG